MEVSAVVPHFWSQTSILVNFLKRNMPEGKKVSTFIFLHGLNSLSFILSTIWHAGASYLNIRGVGYVATSAKRMVALMLQWERLEST
jgi:hypothetical protein